MLASLDLSKDAVALAFPLEAAEGFLQILALTNFYKYQVSFTPLYALAFLSTRLSWRPAEPSAT